MAEKIRINLSNSLKKSSDEQFLKAPRNWQKCSALTSVLTKNACAAAILIFLMFSILPSLL
jgi:hypothetical protein